MTALLREPALLSIMLYILETRFIGRNYAADSIDLSSLKFFDGLRNNILFLQEWRFRRSRSSKVINFGASRKRVCDLLLVRNSNLGPTLHRFGGMAAFMCSWPHPYSKLILGVFPLHQIAHIGVNKRMGL